MSSRVWIGIVLVAVTAGSASVLGIPGPGRFVEPWNAVQRGMAGGGEALVDKVSYSSRSPARNAFNDKTAFTFGVGFENGVSEWNGLREEQRDFSFQSIGFGTPIGFLGNISLSYEPVAVRNVEMTSSSGTAALTGNLQEVVASWSLRFPFERRLALGAAWHQTIGTEKTALQWPLSSDEQEKINATSRIDLEQKIRSSGGRPAASVFWFGKRVSMSAWWAPEYRLERELDRTAQLTELLGIYGYTSVVFSDDRPGEVSSHQTEKWEQTVPQFGGAALSLRLTRLQSIHLDFHQEAWAGTDGWRVAEPFGTAWIVQMETARRFSLGWAYEGSPRNFDSIWKRARYRAGVRWADLEIQGVQEVAGSVGGGFPLGRRGALIDFAAEAGRRYSESGGTPDETFIGLYFGLTGLGQWGEPSRRKY